LTKSYPSYSNGNYIDTDAKPMGTNGRLTFLGTLQALERRVEGPDGFVTKGKQASEVIKQPFDTQNTYEWGSATQAVNNIVWPTPSWECPPMKEPFDFGNIYDKTPDVVIRALNHQNGDAKNEIFYSNKVGPQSNWAFIVTFEQKMYLFDNQENPTCTP
jgi:hypothetical protein